MAAVEFAKAWIVAVAGLAALLCPGPPATAQQQQQRLAQQPRMAQQPRVVPPRGSPLAGRPDTEGAMRLVPLAAPAQPTAADKLPLAQLKLPRGFRIELYAAGVADARSLRVGDKGTVFAGSALLDRVSAVVSWDGRAEVKVIASGLHRPNGLAYKDGTLYIAEVARISKIEQVEDHLDYPGRRRS